MKSSATMIASILLAFVTLYLLIAMRANAVDQYRSQCERIMSADQRQTWLECPY